MDREFQFGEDEQVLKVDGVDGSVTARIYLMPQNCTLTMVTVVNFFFFLSFCYFVGLLPRHMEVPRLGVESEL